jgi:branched-chain amino acid aminotransferase
MSARAFDGKWKPFARVRLSLEDRAVLYGYTVFETLRMEEGVPLFWRDHKRRLTRSLRLLGFPESTRLLREVDEAVASAPKFEHGLLRVTISRGEGRGLTRPATPRVYASLHPITPPAEPTGVKLALVDAPRMIGLFAAKHGNYAFAGASLAHMPKGCGDVLFCAGNERVYETSVGNLAIVTGRTILTPPADGTILEGTTRNLLFALSKKLGLTMHESVLRVPDVLDCDEAFVTSSIAGLTHVTHLGGRRLSGDGTLTRALFGVYRERVKAEIQKGRVS